MIRRWMAAIVAAGCCAGALTAVPAIAAPFGAQGKTTAQTPPCTKAAIAAGLKRGVKSSAGKVGGYGCAGSFAYAEVDTSKFTYTALFKAQGTKWVGVSRAKYCKGKQVPKKIYKPACETN